MNRKFLPFNLHSDFAGIGCAACLVAGIVAIGSCTGPANQSAGPMRYDASQALPPLGAREAPPASDFETPSQAGGQVGGEELVAAPLMPLDSWERMKLQNGARLRANEEAQRLRDEQSEIATAARPPVMWHAVQPPPREDPPVYEGPQASSESLRLIGPPSPNPTASFASVEQRADSQAQSAPPVLKLADLIPPLKSQLAMQAADSSSPLREHLVAAALLMLDGQRRTDPQTIHDLTDREREVLSAYQDFFAKAGESFSSGAGVDALLKQTQEVAGTLNAAGQLRIADFRLCSRIVNFGLYDEVESYKFPAMRPTPLLTYVEIEGFKSVPGGDGKYVTRVRHELELYTERDGQMVYAWPAAPAEDICGKVRHDFFLPRQIQLPSNLTMGRYRLKVRIIDEQSQNQAESVVAFSIVAGGDVALQK